MIASRTAAPAGRTGRRRRITRLKASTITARNMASSSGVMISAIQRKVAPARMTAMITRALRAMDEVGATIMGVGLDL